MTADFIRKTHMSHEIRLEESGFNVFKFLYHVFSEQLGSLLNREKDLLMSDFSVFKQANQYDFFNKEHIILNQIAYR